MKKLMKSFVVLAVIAIALGSASAVFAQVSDPEDNAQGTTIGFGGLGIGSRSKRGGRGAGSMLNYQNRDSFEDGLLHDEMMAAFEEKLGLAAGVLETRLADGESMAEIAISTGLTLEEFRTILNDVRTLVHEEAGAKGLLPGSQSGWLNERGSAMGGFGARRGGGQGMFGSGDCLID